tara:strand:+ start:288 stop:716 length:429 start_codon:yes stop_codon:yes gene_type:complete
MGGGGKPPKPPKVETPPPPVEDVSAAYQSPTMRQEVARRQRRGAFATRGQTLGASGEVLGASPVELANVREVTGTDTPEKELSKEEFLKENPNVGKIGISVKGSYITERNKRLQQKAYDNYLKKLRKEQKQSMSARTKGQTI